jgi:HK97 family phage major capsid protein
MSCEALLTRRRTAETTSPVDPARHIRTAPAATTPPAASNRTLAQLRTDHAAAIAEADQLQTRSRTAPLSAEEQARLVSLVDTAEQLAGEIDQAHTAERLAAQRLRATNPTRPAPTPPAVHVGTGRDQVSEEEGFRIWIGSFGGTVSPDEVYRARTAGFDVGRNRAEFGCNYGGSLNRRKRTVSKGETPGAAFVPQTYSDKVTEYLTYFSPIVGMVDSETTADANDRTYFIVNDTAMISAYITASSGTELAPTIPDVDPALTSKTISARTITSGYHKITREATRDLAVSLTDKVAKAVGNSHARKLERDIVIGSGTGEAKGIVTAGTIYGSAVDDITPAILDGMFFNCPEQYRYGSVWLMHPTTMAKMRTKFVDDTGRTLLSDTLEGDRRILRYGGLPIVSSNYMPAWGASAKIISLVNPMFYMLRLVAGQTLDVLTEKFYPHIAYSGTMAFGGDYLGPTTANTYLQLDAGPEGT